MRSIPHLGSFGLGRFRRRRPLCRCCGRRGGGRRELRAVAELLHHRVFHGLADSLGRENDIS